MRARCWKKWFAAAAMLAAAATAGAETLRFTVVGIDCKECGPPILKALRAVPGVRSAALDWKAGVATVETSEAADRDLLRRALTSIGFEAVFPGETRRDLEPLPEDVRRTLDISALSNGEKVDFARVAVPGKITLLDYWAEWCSPCHLLEIRFQHLLRENSGLAVRRVDVGDWNNAAARQGTREFGIEALPYVRVYDRAGKYVGQVTGGSWDRILELIEKAQGRGGA